MELPKFYRSNASFQEIHNNLKQILCPHCRTPQNLILHGYLYGFDYKTYSKRIIRGHRIFCSNRNRRKGCGKTFSIFLKLFIKNFIVNTKNLWQFLNNITKEKNKTKAFRSLNLPFSETTFYRLFKRFIIKQHKIRTYLNKMSKPPKYSHHIKATYIETIIHCSVAFKMQNNPISAFQEHFQISFL